jgi:alpha-tubulin suppressor-like RCC1 family protein
MNCEPAFSGLCQHYSFVGEDGALYTWGSNVSLNTGKVVRQVPGVSAEIRKIELPEEGGRSERGLKERRGGSEVISMGGGAHSTIVLTRDGRLFAWGDNSKGQLGLGSDIQAFDTPTLIQVPPGLSRPVKVFSSGYSSKVLLEDGSLLVWGSNETAELGLGHTYPQISPAHLVLPSPVAHVTGGWYHTMALTEGGDLYVWGKNEDGKLGLGGSQMETRPVLHPLKDIVRISCGGHHSLALTKNGDAYAWGWSNQGQLGIGYNKSDVFTATLIENFKFSEICAGWGHSMGLLQDGTLASWGCSGYQTSELEIPLSPERVDLPKTVKEITCFGATHTSSFLVDQDGKVYFWGYGDFPKTGELSGQRGPVASFPDLVVQIPPGKKWWSEVFLWQFLGNLDRNSIFFNFPKEIIFYGVHKIYAK